MKIFKIAFLMLFAVGFMNSNAVAQDNYKASMAGWLVSLEEAYDISAKTGKPILANFTGTDWCIWCKRLREAVFEKEEFKRWADKNVVLLELDFPRRTQIPEEVKAQNYQLQQLFKVRGYPTVWVFNATKDKSGKINIDAMGSTGYKQSPDLFIADMERIMANAKSR